MFASTPNGSKQVRRRTGIVPLAVATLLLATASGGPAFAAPLPVVPTYSHYAVTIAGATGAPTVYASDGFNRANALLSASPTTLTGGTWTVWSGTWRVQGNRLLTTPGAAFANISTQTNRTDVRIIVTMTLGATANAGLQINDSGTKALRLLYSPAAGGTMQLVKYAPGASTLQTTTGVGTFTNSTIVLSALTTATTLTATINGTAVFNYTYTAADLADVKQPTNSYHGLWAENDAVTQFDDFRAESP